MNTESVVLMEISITLEFFWLVLFCYLNKTLVIKLETFIKLALVSSWWKSNKGYFYCLNDTTSYHNSPLRSLSTCYEILMLVYLIQWFSDKTAEKADSKKVKKTASSSSLSTSPGNQSSLPQPQYEGLWSHNSLWLVVTYHTCIWLQGIKDC